MQSRNRTLLFLVTALSGAALLFIIIPSAPGTEAASMESGGPVVPRTDDSRAEVSVAIPSLNGDVVVTAREARTTPVQEGSADTTTTAEEEPAAEGVEEVRAVVSFIDNFEEIERWHSQLMDRSSSLEDKIAALDMLRFHKLEDGQDARTDDDFQEALWMLEIATLDKERLGVLRAMKGFRQPELLDDLLNLLRNDPSPRVRAEAAEVLGGFGNNKQALAALREARKNDPHEHVREKCEEILM